MVSMEAVVETERARGFGKWEIATGQGELLRLSGQMAGAEVGSVLAVLAEYNDAEAADPAATLRELVAADGLIAPGGLRVRDAAGGVLVPRCCCGLEDWREWAGLLERETPWLGHGPDLEAEYGADAVHLWQDVQRADAGRVTLPYDRLPVLLEGVRGELVAFLRLVGEWAAPYGTEVRDTLCAKLDEEFSFTEPWEPPH